MAEFINHLIQFGMWVFFVIFEERALMAMARYSTRRAGFRFLPPQRGWNGRVHQPSDPVRNVGVLRDLRGEGANGHGAIFDPSRRVPFFATATGLEWQSSSTI